MRGVRLFCGISETKWNHHAIDCGEFACISPVKGASIRTKAENRVFVPDGVLVGQDSGAFQDSWGDRLSFQQALDRQRRHAAKYNYADKIIWRVSYDLLIDEVWQDGQRTKKRWTVEKAKSAVAQTIAASAFLKANNSEDYPLCLSVQGVDATQYMGCAKEIIPMLDLSRDTLGLGGWCIIGKMPKIMLPVFRDTIQRLIPYAAKQGVKRLHIFGVIYPQALGELLWLCNQYGLELSTDSASPSTHPIWGEWGYGEWRNNDYQRAPVETRGIERVKHVQLTRVWLENLHCTKWHKAPQFVPIPKDIKTNQLDMFEAVL